MLPATLAAGRSLQNAAALDVTDTKPSPGIAGPAAFQGPDQVQNAFDLQLSCAGLKLTRVHWQLALLATVYQSPGGGGSAYTVCCAIGRR